MTQGRGVDRPSGSPDKGRPGRSSTPPDGVGRSDADGISASLCGPQYSPALEPAGTPQPADALEPDWLSADTIPDDEGDLGASHGDVLPPEAYWDLGADPEDGWRFRGRELMAEATEQLGDDLAALAAMPGGRWLASLLERFEDGDLTELDRPAIVEVLTAAKRVSAWAESVAARAAGAMAAEAVLFDHPDHSSSDADPARAHGRGPEVSTRRRLDATAEEIAMRLAISRHEAGRLARLGRGVTGTLHDTGRALARGEIDVRKATALVCAVDRSPGPAAWAVEQELLPRAHGLTARQITQEAQRLLVEVDPEDAQRRHARARAERRVTRMRMTGDGMAAITAHLPAEDCLLVDQTLTAVARTARAGGDARSTDQLRADTLIALTRAGIVTGSTDPAAWADPDRPDPTDRTNPTDRTGGETGRASSTAHPGVADSRPPDLAASGPPAVAAPMPPDVAILSPVLAGQLRAGPVEKLSVSRPELRIDVPWNVIQEGLAEGEADLIEHKTDLIEHETGRPQRPPDLSRRSLPTLGIDAEPSRAAYLHGYGALSGDVARAVLAAALATGGILRRIVTDPHTGALLDLGRKRYRPSKALAEFVRARDRTCARPGCTVPAMDSEIDHITPWHHGGATDAGNLQALCSRCHSLKSAGALRVRHAGDGTEWTAPSGHTYRRERDGTVRLLRLGDPPF